MVTEKTLKQYYNAMGKADFNQQLYKNPNPYRRWFHQARKRAVLNLVKKAIKHSPGNAKLLDAGCGDGEYIDSIISMWIDWKLYLNVFALDVSPYRLVYGVDISSTFIDLAKKKHAYIKSKFKIASLEKLPYKNNQFDIVLCSEALEHVLNYPKALSEIVRVCNKYLIISVPIEKSHPFVRLGLKILGKKDMISSGTHADGKGFEDLKGGHLREFTSELIDTDLRRYGLKIVKRKKIHNSALIAVFFILSEKLPFLIKIARPIIRLINLIDKLFPWWGMTYVVVARKT